MTDLTVDQDISSDDEFDPVASMFGPGAPGVGIGGVDVLRSTLGPTEQDEEGSAEQTLHWHISAVPRRGDTPPAFLGDLFVMKGNWFVAVTVAMPLAFADDYPLPDLSEKKALDAFATSLGPWAANILYDVAAIQARQLISASMFCDVELPRVTPRAHIAHLSRDKTTTKVE